MSFFSFSKDAAAFDVTPIENEFLMEFMPNAPESALRVYLYARMLCLHPEMGELADMAKALRMDQDEVLEAFGYWEQRGLVEKMSDRPPRFEMRSLRDERVTPNQIDLGIYKYGELHAALNAIFDKGELERRHYLMACDWLDLWGLTQDAVLKIVEFERRLPGGRTPDPVFKRADRRVKDWAERGIRTLDEVNKAIDFEDRVYKTASAVLEQLAIRRGVTENELDCVRRWIDEWHLTTEEVLEACAETTKSRNPSIAYLDTILKTKADKGANVHFDAMKDVLRELNAVSATPTPEQMNAYAGYLEKGFEPETVRLAAVQSARRGKNRFDDLEWMLNAWSDLGIRTRAQAEAYIQDMRRKAEEMGALLKIAGLDRRPNRSDLDSYEGWKRTYSDALIQCAAELARGSREPVKYMNKLLVNWAKAGVTTPEAARAAAPKPASAGQGSGTAARKESAPQRDNYLRHEYKDEDFGENFYYDPTKDYPEEGGKK